VNTLSADTILVKMLRSDSLANTKWIRTDSLRARAITSDSTINNTWTRTDSLRSRAINSDSIINSTWMRTDSLRSRAISNTGLISTTRLNVSDSILAAKLNVTGATTLGSTLDVVGATRLITLGGTASTSIPGGFDRIVVADSTGRLEEVSTATLIGSTAWALGGNSITDPTTQFLGTTSNQPLVIRTNNTEQVRVSAAGNVGIGTANPSSALEIRRTVADGADSTFVTLVSGGSSGGHGATIDFKNGGAGYYASIAGLDDWDRDGRLEFRLSNDGIITPTRLTSANTVMMINQLGNVGIGTGVATPAARLEVKTASAGTIFSGTNSSNNAGFSFSTDAADRASLTVNGGSSGPAAGAYFTANGRQEAWFNVNATLNTAGLRYMRFGNSSNGVTNAFAIQLLNDAGTAVVSTPFRLQNAAPTNSFVIDAAGNVGLGVAIPSARLDVAGTVNATGLATLSGGITETGTASINTTGTAATTIGNTTAATAVTINTGSTGGLTLGGLTTATSSTDDVLIIGGTDKVSRISQANLVAGTTWALTGNEITTSSGALGAAPTGSFFGTRSTSTAKDVRIATNGLTRMIVAGDGSISMGGTLGVTGATTLADLGGTASTSLPSGFDRLVIADTSGLLNEISIATLVGVSWQLTGNNLGAVTATLGSAPSGPYLGTTTGNTQDLQISMNNVVQAIIKTTGEMQLNKDMKVNDVVVGRGASSVASNTAIGAQALSNNSATGTNNTAVGNVALLSNTTGQYNTATGAGALYNNVDGSSNSGFGANALYNNQSGDNNVATGSNALYSNTLGDQNVAIGSATLQKNTIGNGNVALGHTALYNNLSGSNNVALGNAAGYNETGSNKLYIANSSSNNLIYGDFSTGTLSINA
ncbi:MAG: beta strand repeat-containing protein, partial [Candidatus Kapaibacterium sp.]